MRFVRSTIFISLLFAGAARADVTHAVAPAVQSVENLFPLSAVRVTGGPFKIAQETDKAYLLKLDPDRFLHFMRQVSGLTPKAPPYGGWDSGGSGMVGHYLSAVSLMYQATGDEELGKRVDYIVSEMAECQAHAGDGSLHSFAWDRDNYFARMKNGDLMKRAVTGWYVLHKTMAGLRDAYALRGKTQARDVLVKLCDWTIDVTAKLSDDQWQQMLDGEHGGPNEILADVYALTGDKQYLACAEKFTHRKVFDALSRNETRVLDDLHANTQIPKFVGFERVYELTGETKWHDAASNFWNDVVQHRSWVTGGNSQWERFFPENQFARELGETCGPETCNTYNMLKLTKQLFSLEPRGPQRATYVDYYERATYNSILPSQNEQHGGFVYYTSMRPGHYRVFSTPEDSFWCCVGTGMENHSKYGELIYSHKGDDALSINLLAPSTLDWKERGLQLTQETTFPASDTSTVTLKLKRPTTLNLSIRYPSWSGPMRVLVNGKAVDLKGAKAGSYADVQREWRDGDVVTVRWPMSITTESLPESKDYAAVLYGPVVLAAALDASDLTDADFRNKDQSAKKVKSQLTAPALIGSAKEIASQFRAVVGKSLTFTGGEAVRPAATTLVPFYTIGDARYAIYMRLTDARSYAAAQERLKASEKDELDLGQRTVDHVRVGEQQSEADHHLVARDGRTGNAAPPFTHWRDDRQGFSYEMAVDDKFPLAVRCAFWGSDTGRTFDILVNGVVVDTQKLTASQPGEYVIAAYAIPVGAVKGKNVVTVEFRAPPGGVAGGVFDVRVVKVGK